MKRTFLEKRSANCFKNELKLHRFSFFFVYSLDFAVLTASLQRHSPPKDSGSALFEHQRAEKSQVDTRGGKI